MTLVDPHGRRFSYLRLSITDQCNFRCQYCLPGGYQKTCAPDFLSIDEIVRLARAMAGLGVWKIRLTGGEPTLRRDLTEVIAKLSAIEGIRTIALTTNGYNLAQHIARWRTAGLNHLNVSVDSLDPANFHAITGHDLLSKVLQGVAAARQTGLSPIKINTVLLGGINDHETDAMIDWAKREALSLRFIELMQTGDNATYFKQHHLSAAVVQQRLEQSGWRLQERSEGAGPAKIYHHADHGGTVGLIAPYSKDFCASCNRLRVTARGDLRLCLFGGVDYPLRPYLQNDDQLPELQDRLLQVLNHKSATHYLQQGQTGLTSHLAALGG